MYVEIQNTFFNLTLAVEPAVDGGIGNSAMPTRIVFEPEQCAGMKPMEVDFVGELEFDNFRQNLRALDRALTEAFGELGPGTMTIVVTKGYDHGQ